MPSALMSPQRHPLPDSPAASPILRRFPSNGTTTPLRLPRLALIAIAILLPLIGPLMAVKSAQAAGQRELQLLIWSEYLDPTVVTEFEATCDCHLRQIYYETDEDRDRMVQDTEGAGFDLALLNDVMIAPYAKRGWLAEIDHDKIPNIKNVDPRWLSAFAGAGTYAVPYFWGTLGIAYDSGKVTWPIKSWMDLFRPNEILRQRIIMLNDARDTIGMALLALGYSLNESDPKALAAAGQLLEQQRPYVRTYSYVGLSQESGIVSGDFLMAMIYNGDAITLQKIDPSIRYVVPEEGSNLWADYLVILNKSNNKDLALSFINFINDPKIAARLAMYSNYATPNKTAEKYLPAWFTDNPAIYPPPAVLERSQTYQPMPPRAIKARNAIFAKLTR